MMASSDQVKATCFQRYTYLAVGARIKEFHIYINAPQILHIGHRRFLGHRWPIFIAGRVENEEKQGGRIANLILRNSQEKWTKLRQRLLKTLVRRFSSCSTAATFLRYLWVELNRCRVHRVYEQPSSNKGIPVPLKTTRKPLQRMLATIVDDLVQ